MFMVLGSMIGQLNEGNVGEHQLRLIFAVQRTCAGMRKEQKEKRIFLDFYVINAFPNDKF